MLYKKYNNLTDILTFINRDITRTNAKRQELSKDDQNITGYAVNPL